MYVATFVLWILCWASVGLHCVAINSTHRKSNNLYIYPEKSTRSARVVRSPHVIIPTVENTFILRLACTKQNLEIFMTSFYAKAADEDIAFRHIYTYAYAFHGFAIALSNPNDIRLIEEMELDCLVDIESDSMLSLPQTETTVKDLTEGHDIVDLPRAYMKIPLITGSHKSKINLVKVALLDQGIKFTDKAFVLDDIFGVSKRRCTKYVRTGCRVTTILDFVASERAGNFSEGLLDYVPVHDKETAVYGNHGTVMAGIIGGSRFVTSGQENKAPGMAPNVFFHDYRIVDETGHAPKSRTYSALDLAINRKADVICISLDGMDYDMRKMHGPFFKPDSKEEIFVVASVGLRGKNNFLFQGNSLAQIPGVAAIGSFFNPVHKFYRIKFDFLRTKKSPFQTDFKVYGLRRDDFDQFLNPLKLFEFVPMRHEAIDDPTSVWAFKALEHFFVVLTCKTAEQCLDQVGHFQGKSQVLGILFAYKLPIHPWLFKEISLPLGIILNLPDDFENLSFYAMRGIGYFEVDVEQVSTTAPFPALESSMGPSHHFYMSPDACVISDGIRMYFGDDNGRPQYQVGFGIARSAAVFTGLVAEFAVANQLARNVTFMAADLYTRMRNTATPRMYSQPHILYSPELKDMAYSVLKQGAGLIQVDAMMKTKMRVLPSRLQMVYSPTYAQLDPHEPRTRCIFKRPITIKNFGPCGVMYKFQHIPAASTRYYAEGTEHFWEQHGLTIQFSIPQALRSDFQNANTQIAKVYVEKESTVEFDAVFSISPSMPHYIIFSGYLKFVPVFLENQGVFQGHLQVPEYPMLSVPYFLFYGNKYEFPVIVRAGERAAFLTSSKIEFVNHVIHPDYPLRNPPQFSIYESLLAIPEFSLLKEDRPVICMCPLLPLKSMSLHLLSFPMVVELGEISSYKNVPPVCSLFLYPSRIDIGKLFPSEGSRMDQSNSHSWLSHGWNGLYIPATNSSTHVQVECGYYMICAKVTLDITDRRRSYTRYDWCSYPFKTGCAIKL